MSGFLRSRERPSNLSWEWKKSDVKQCFINAFQRLSQPGSFLLYIILFLIIRKGNRVSNFFVSAKIKTTNPAVQDIFTWPTIFPVEIHLTSTSWYVLSYSFKAQLPIITAVAAPTINNLLLRQRQMSSMI